MGHGQETMNDAIITSEGYAHFDDFVGIPESLLNLNELQSPDSNLLPCQSDSGLEEFCREPVPFATETNEFYVGYSDQSNVQSVKCFNDADGSHILHNLRTCSRAGPGVKFDAVWTFLRFFATKYRSM